MTQIRIIIVIHAVYALVISLGCTNSDYLYHYQTDIIIFGGIRINKIIQVANFVFDVSAIKMNFHPPISSYFVIIL